MDQQEQAFLSAALGVHDERLQRRLLVGFHLIRDCCRIADDPSWVPRVRVAKEALDQALWYGTFAPVDLEIAALSDLLRALDSDKPERPAVYSALSAYTIALYRENNFSAAVATLDVLDRLWTPECRVRDRLEAAYYQGLLLVQGRYSRDASSYASILLALRARAANELEFIALAGVVHLNRTLLSGNLPLAIREGEKRLRQLRHHPSARAEGTLINSIAAVHGRAGRPSDALRTANRLLDDRYPPHVRFGALNIVGTAFIDLGELDAARAACEMMLLAPNSGLRRLAALGLMDIHARRMERHGFERIYRYLADQPLSVEVRIYFCQASGRGWAKLGDVSRARAAFDEAYQIARECGLGYEIFETEELIDKLPDPSQFAQAGGIAPEIAARVTALRDERAEEIAACLS